MKTIKFMLNLFLGIILYIISPSFRATVNAKLRGLNETTNTGENVVAVLSTGENKRHIERR